MTPEFDLKQGGSSQFMFNLKAGNNEVTLAPVVDLAKVSRLYSMQQQLCLC